MISHKYRISITLQHHLRLLIQLPLTMAIHLFILLLALSALSSSGSASVFESIDCGSNDYYYTDANSITWTGDDTKNGEAQVVQATNSVSTVMDSLRVFKSRNKNCYNVAVDKGEKILVRASFFYGNYDKKSSPPSFDLHFDGNYWTTVETSSTKVKIYEVTYVPNGEVTSVCVAQTKPNQFPFMSALEVRGLGSHMYSHVDPGYALFGKNTVAYGASSVVRFASDAYDRMWIPATDGHTAVVSDALVVDATTIPDDPPQAVLLNAITSSASSDLDLVTDFPSTEVPIYMTMYFSEVMALDTTEKRSFQIYKDGKPISDPILPPYRGVIEMYITNMTASSDTKFSLVATSDSDHPPIINAMEVFYVSENKLTDGTNSDDVDGLAKLQDSVTGFDVLQEWGSDPCLPAPYSWDWINCTNSATPRVTALYLSGYGLEGSLLDFSSMTYLETIDLSNNNLTGEIPDFLGSFPNLKKLNLGDNLFSGEIPDSLTKNSKLTLVTTGNTDLCKPGKSCDTTTTTDTSSPGADGSPPTSKSPSGKVKTKKKSKTGSIVGGTLGSFFGFWVIAGVTALWQQRRKRAAVTAMAMNGVANGVQMGENVMNQFASTAGEQVEVDITDKHDEH